MHDGRPGDHRGRKQTLRCHPKAEEAKGRGRGGSTRGAERTPPPRTGSHWGRPVGGGTRRGCPFGCGKGRWVDSPPRLEYLCSLFVKTRPTVTPAPSSCISARPADSVLGEELEAREDEPGTHPRHSPRSRLRRVQWSVFCGHPRSRGAHGGPANAIPARVRAGVSGRGERSIQRAEQRGPPSPRRVATSKPTGPVRPLLLPDITSWFRRLRPPPEPPRRRPGPPAAGGRRGASAVRGGFRHESPPPCPQALSALALWTALATAAARPLFGLTAPTCGQELGTCRTLGGLRCMVRDGSPKQKTSF